MHLNVGLALVELLNELLRALRIRLRTPYLIPEVDGDLRLRRGRETAESCNGGYKFQFPECQDLFLPLDGILDAGDCPIILGDYNPVRTEGGLPGYKIGQKLLDHEKPTAIVAGSDILAAGVLQAIYERGLRVPNDVSVIGYDDSVASLLAPPLSSIAQPFEMIGEEALKLVEASTRPRGSDDATAWVKTSLVERSSVGPVKKI